MRNSRSVVSPLTTLALALYAVLLGTAAHAEGLLTPLHPKMAELAEKIKEIVKDRAVTVGEFVPPADMHGGGGAGLQQALIEELAAANVRVKVGADAPLEIQGRFQMAKNQDADDQQQQLLLLVSIVKKETAAEEGNARAFVDDPTTMIWSLGLSGRHGDGEGLSRWLRHSADDPAIVVKGSIVKTTEDSPYGLQVFIKQTDRGTGRATFTACAAREQNGQAFIDIDLGQAYVVKVTNKSQDEVGVQLFIDGLDQFTFQEEHNPVTGQPFSRRIVAAGKSETIDGWFHTLNRSRDFEVAPAGAGEASHLLGSSAKIGTITATFAPRQTPAPKETVSIPSPSPSPSPPPNPTAPAESSSPRFNPVQPGNPARPNAETKQGDTVSTKINAVRFDSGPVAEWITVRYNRPANTGK